MNILISGVAGFIGANLSRALVKKGHNIYGVDDLSVGNKNYLPEGIVFQEVNIADKNNIGAGCGNIDLIIHLSSRKIPREGNPDVVLRENALGMINIVNLAKTLDARIVFTSTSDIYGKPSGPASSLESENNDSVIGPPDVSRWSYAVSKMWCEQYLYGQKGIRFNIIRLFASYGSYNSRSWRAGPIPVFIEQALKKEPITIHGTGRQTRCFMYADDAVDGIMRVIERDDINLQIFNLANPAEEVSVNKLASMVWNMVNPGIAMISKTQEHIPGVKYEEVNRRTPCIRKAKKILGFSPAWTLNEGLKKTIKWHRFES